MTKPSYARPLTTLIASTALALSIAGCSLGSGDPISEAKAAFDAHQYGAARIHILSALQENSADPEANLIFGKTLLAMGDGEGAGAAFEKAMRNSAYKDKLKPLYAHALLLTGASDKALALVDDLGGSSNSKEIVAKSYWVKACALLEMGRTEEALAVLDAGLAKMPSDVDLLVLKARYALSIGDTQTASRFAASALKHGPDDLEALQMSGRLAMLRQDLKTAEARFLKAAKIYPESVPPLFSLAAIYADMGDEKKSRDYFGRILKSAPKHPLALFMLAKLEFDKGNVAEAHEMLQVAGDSVSDVPQAILLGGKIANARGNHEIAIARLQRFLAMLPGNIEGMAALGEALAATGNSAQAYDLVKPVAMQANATPDLLALAGKLGQQQGDPLASKFSSRAATSANGDIGRQMKNADAAIKAGNWQRAEEIYAQLRSAGQAKNPMILNNSALVALETGDKAGAQKFAREAHALAPDDAFIMDTLGWVLHKTGGDKGEALALIRKAAAKAPGNREIREHLAAAQL